MPYESNLPNCSTTLTASKYRSTVTLLSQTASPSRVPGVSDPEVEHAALVPKQSQLNRNENPHEHYAASTLGWRKMKQRQNYTAGESLDGETGVAIVYLSFPSIRPARRRWSGGRGRSESRAPLPPRAPISRTPEPYTTATSVVATRGADSGGEWEWISATVAAPLPGEVSTRRRGGDGQMVGGRGAEEGSRRNPS